VDGTGAFVVPPAGAAILTALLTGGPQSRVALARRLGLSPAAVTKAARPLIEAGYVTEAGPAAQTGPGAGRPASPLAVIADREFFAGVKLTADEIIGVVIDLTAQVRAVVHRRLATSAVDDVVAGVAAVTAELLAAGPAFPARTRSLGVSVSGDVDRATGQVRYSPFLRWRDIPLAKLVAARLPKLVAAEPAEIPPAAPAPRPAPARTGPAPQSGLTVTVENDVKALTVAEHWFGDGAGAESFALVTVGAGIGCGLVVNGRLVAGSHGVAGEIGHIAVDPAGPLCHCGARGCVEAIAGTAALEAQAGVPIAEAVLRARGGDEAVRAVFARAGAAIGTGLAAMANLVGPARIVVSGEGLSAYDLFEPHIRDAFERQAFGAAADCPLSIRPLPFDEWARGAAAVSIQARVGP
jgi:predicted NBD/HSP70 family sugar kinase